MDDLAELRSTLERENDDRKRIRHAQVEASEQKARARLREEFHRKLAVLRDAQKAELTELSDKWRRAHAKAEAMDRTAEESNETTMALLRVPLKALEQNNDKHAIRCDEHYAALVKRMLERHQTELDWLKKAFRDELTLLSEEYAIINEKIDDQFRIESKEVAAQLIDAIHANVESHEERQRMIRTLSPSKQRRGFRAVSAATTPVRRVRRSAPNSV